MTPAARVARSFLVWLVCIALAVYLLNPGSGRQELLPDTALFYGNLDEFAAAMILISGLRYFGLDVAKFFDKEPEE
jgi:hypothetical protein